MIRPGSRPRGNSSFMPGSSKAEMFVNSDFKDLLRIINDFQVKYLVVQQLLDSDE